MLWHPCETAKQLARVREADQGTLGVATVATLPEVQWLCWVPLSDSGLIRPSVAQSVL